jgi:hypothetical protein
MNLIEPLARLYETVQPALRHGRGADVEAAFEQCDAELRELLGRHMTAGASVASRRLRAEAALPARAPEPQPALPTVRWRPWRPRP